MEIAYETNTDLAFDTEVLNRAAADYKDIADELRSMSSELDNLIKTLKDSGWTTPAGTAFYEMTETNWSENIEKYASLLECLHDALEDASKNYGNLMLNFVNNTKVSIDIDD